MSSIISVKESDNWQKLQQSPILLILENKEQVVFWYSFAKVLWMLSVYDLYARVSKPNGSNIIKDQRQKQQVNVSL